MRMEPQTATAAVAIIKCLAPEESFLILRRATHPLDPWSGHYSFPGGRKEEKDSSLLETCIRETVEEVGILLSPGTMQKQLPVTPAGRNIQDPIWVQPYIFVLHDKPSIEFNTEEVQSIYWLNSEDFQDTRRHREIELQPGRLFPAFPIEDYYLWGFTYKLLKLILDGVKKG